MKHLYTLLALVFLSACSSGSGENANPYGSMSFSLDTVVVDPGEEIINLKNGIMMSTLSKDKKYLYNFNQEQVTLEKINLDRLVLEDKIPFEKEGPNGTGNYVFRLQMDGNDNLLFSTWNDAGLFNLKGEKIQHFNIKDFEKFSPEFLIGKDRNTLISLIGSWTQSGYELGVLDYENKNLKKFALEDFERTQDYHVTLKSDQGYQIAGQDVKVQEYRGQYLISNSIFNTMALYNPASDSVTYIKYDSRLTENGKTGKYVTEVDSREAFRQVMLQIYQEVTFMAPMWDEEKELFYRFSMKQRQEGEKYPYDVFLTVLDPDFQVLGENQVEALRRTPNNAFVKDGKIWIYENIDDELGFVRLAIE